MVWFTLQATHTRQPSAGTVEPLTGKGKQSICPNKGLTRKSAGKVRLTENKLRLTDEKVRLTEENGSVPGVLTNNLDPPSRVSWEPECSSPRLLHNTGSSAPTHHGMQAPFTSAVKFGRFWAAALDAEQHQRPWDCCRPCMPATVHGLQQAHAVHHCSLICLVVMAAKS
jgi:hypothetical protein